MHNKHSLLENKKIGEMHELALFAGTGGGILGGGLLGWRTVCAVERDAYAAQVLAQRQNDGVLEAFPIWSDVCSFDGTRWRGVVDVVSGGFPCQDISAAGKGAGIEGSRSSMWKQMARIISEVQPRYAFVENSPMLTTRGLGVVLADLATMGFDAEWGVLSAADVGAPHLRERIWILGYSNNNGQVTTKIRTSFNKRVNYSSTRQEKAGKFTRSSEQYAELANTISYGRNQRRHDDGQYDGSILNSNGELQNVADTEKLHRNGGTIYREYSKSKISKFGNSCCQEDVPNTSSKNAQRQRSVTIGVESQLGDIGNASWWITEPYVGRVANGVAFRVDRLKAIGNGQVPLCAATAFILLNERLSK